MKTPGITKSDLIGLKNAIQKRIEKKQMVFLDQQYTMPTLNDVEYEKTVSLDAMQMQSIITPEELLSLLEQRIVESQ